MILIFLKEIHFFITSSLHLEMIYFSSLGTFQNRIFIQHFYLWSQIKVLSKCPYFLSGDEANFKFWILWNAWCICYLIDIDFHWKYYYLKKFKKSRVSFRIHYLMMAGDALFSKVCMWVHVCVCIYT